MIDLEKEREAFQEHFNGEYEYVFGECFNQEKGYFYEGKHDKSAYFAFEAWKKCAESKQAEIDSLKAQLAKVESSDYVLVPTSQLNQWGHMANYAQEYGCPECFESRGYAHNLACEINEYFKPAEAAQENSHE